MNDYIVKVTEMLKKAGLPYAFVSSVFEDSAKSKEALNDLLGLNEENHYRKPMPISMTDADFNSMYPFVKSFFQGVPGWVPPLKPTTGKLTVGKDQVNITKFLSKALADNTVPRDHKDYIMTNLGIDKTNPKAESQIVPKLGELLNKKDTNVVVVSTNPFDFFTSSAGEFKYAAFKSCYRPGGEYFNGCNSLARDNFSTIAFKASADKLDYKHGRAWMFVLDKAVAQTKSYGTFTNNERKVAREFVQQQLSEHHQFDLKEYKHHNVEKWKNKTNANVLYFDDYSIDLGYPTSAFPTGMSDNRVPKIHFSNAKCLKCGRETQYPTQGICGICSGNYRECCGCKADLYGGRDNNINGKHYCPECTEKKFDTCGCCGNFYEKGKHTDVNGVHVCPTCMKDRFYFCDHCNTYHELRVTKAHIITKAGNKSEKWCANCFKKDAFQCSDCGNNHEKDRQHTLVVSGGAKVVICSDCLPKYTTCPDCGIAFKDGHETCNGLVCSACFTKYEFCVHCNTFVLADSMQFDGETFSCAGCAEKRQATDASHDRYIKAVENIIEVIKAEELLKTGDAAAIMQQIVDDRAANGFQEGDVLRIVKDDSYHQYPIGTLVVNCKRYDNANGTVAYCTFRDKTEWFVKATDVEFARPALVAGDSFTSGSVERVVESVRVNPNYSIDYIAVGKPFPAESCTPVGIIDPKAFGTPQFKAGEVVTITANYSQHPYKEGDRVKVMHVDKTYDIPRYYVKKGTKYGVIWGAVLDIVRDPKAPADALATAKKPARKVKPVEEKW